MICAIELFSSKVTIEEVTEYVGEPTHIFPMGKLGTERGTPGPLITPEPFVSLTLSTYPNACIRLDEPVGATFVYPPPTPTYTRSPLLKSEVFTPLMKPSSKITPSASSNICSPAIPPAGILAGLLASAGNTPTTLPAVPLPVKYRGVPFSIVVPERFLP